MDNSFKVQCFPIVLDSTTETAEEPDGKRPRSDVPFTLSADAAATYVYYFQPIQPPRKLDKDKCFAFGVPKSVFQSPAVRDLLDGKSITLSSGYVVTSEEVTSPAPPSPNFLVVDCPSLAVLRSLMRDTGENRLFDALAERQPPAVDSEDDSGGATGSVFPGVSLVVHFVPKDLFASPEYQEFVHRLDSISKRSTAELNERDPGLPDPCLLEHPVQHLLVDETGFVPSVKGIFSQATLLNHYFDASVYPLLRDISSDERRKEITEAAKEGPQPFARVVHSQPQMQYFVRPWKGLSLPLEDFSLEAEHIIAEAFDPLYADRTEVELELDKMRRNLSQLDLLPESRDIPSEGGVKRHRLSDELYPQVTILGTGSSCPSKYRNTSGILVQLNPEDYILLDCGEGTLNQLYALYGSSGTEHILARLRAVLITHMHADHHGGVFTIALARSRLLNSRPDQMLSPQLLPVLAPPAFARWASSFTGLFSHGPTISLFLIPCVYLAHPNSEEYRLRPGWQVRREDVDEQRQTLVSDWLDLLSRLRLKVEPVKVPHTGTSWAFVLRGQRWSKRGSSPSEEEEEAKTMSSGDGDSQLWSIVYSGDTPYCDDLVLAGRDCDLLIHEATMVDDHLDLAVRAKHSTVGSAIRAGEAMNAGFTLLTHFSQRYGRITVLDEHRPAVATAFDFMQIRFGDLDRLPHYQEYYNLVFAKHWSHFQTKVDAYAWRKHREKETSASDRLLQLMGSAQAPEASG